MNKISDIALVKQPINFHFNELRKRLFFALSFYVLGVILSYYYVNDIYIFLVKPLNNIYHELGIERKLIYTGLTEAFFTQLKIAFFAGCFISFPFVAWQIYSFLAPGLFKRERKLILPYIFFAPIMFISGAVLVYYYLMPIAWRFFINFEIRGYDTIPLILEARISEYLSLVISLILAFGLAFQLPVILILLVHIDFISVNFLIKGRRYAVVIIFLAAAILTPPDVISQIALAIPLMLLYEISILICRKIKKVRKNARHKIN